MAVGSVGFVEQVKNELSFRAQHRQASMGGLYALREPVPPYGDHFDRENEALRPNNTVPGQPKLETIERLVRPNPRSLCFQALSSEQKFSS
jgi:hypothetical protein